MTFLSLRLNLTEMSNIHSVLGQKGTINLSKTLNTSQNLTLSDISIKKCQPKFKGELIKLELMFPMKKP